MCVVNNLGVETENKTRVLLSQKLTSLFHTHKINFSNSRLQILSFPLLPKLAAGDPDPGLPLRPGPAGGGEGAAEAGRSQRQRPRQGAHSGTEPHEPRFHSTAAW